MGRVGTVTVHPDVLARPLAAPRLPPALLGAAAFAATGVSCLLVGSAALWLHGETGTDGEAIAVRDTDVVIEPSEDNLCLLREALAELTTRPGVVPSAWRLRAADIVTVPTSFGMIDCMLERGRADWPRLRGRASVIAVAGVDVVVAGRDDAWDLRRRFKE